MGTRREFLVLELQSRNGAKLGFSGTVSVGLYYAISYRVSLMAEVHILGNLSGARNFKESSLCCKYEIIAGQGWNLLEGISSGQTHVDSPIEVNQFVWNQPIDLHYNTKSLAGWPKLAVKVFQQDMFGRNSLIAYGFAHIPSKPGIHDVEINTWRPVGSASDELNSRFLGTAVHLIDETLVYEPVDRFRLMTKTMGIVNSKIMVVIRNFKKSGITL